MMEDIRIEALALRRNLLRMTQRTLFSVGEFAKASDSLQSSDWTGVDIAVAHKARLSVGLTPPTVRLCDEDGDVVLSVSLDGVRIDPCASDWEDEILTYGRLIRGVA